MSNEHTPIFRLDDCEATITVDATTFPTVQLSIDIDELDYPRVLNLTADDVAALTAALARAQWIAGMNAMNMKGGVE